MRQGMAVLLALAVVATASPAFAGEVVASPPRDLSVTVYRAPYRNGGSIDLSNLNGFALISETRVVSLPVGESRLRFEGVAAGIDPASAIVTGLPSGVIEKNRDAHLLSPSALVAMAVGRPVELVRSRPHVAKAERVEGRILSDAEGGVVFQGPDGIEALRCSGLPESFSFDADTTGLSALPTLSVLTRSAAPVTATVTLTYLASGFDWAADYVATLSKDGRTLDLGAWVTLANANGESFPSARAQVVAGRLNRRTGQVEPIDEGSPILAQCWPRGSTSDSPAPVRLERAVAMQEALAPPMPLPLSPAAARVMEVTVTGARRAELEQLGDLKLYRIPDRTTVASRQAKQVRLLDRSKVPVQRIYGAELVSGQDVLAHPASVLLRTTNDAAHHLGLPLPSGEVAIYQPRAGTPLLVGETRSRDLAVDETVEWRLGPAPDIQVAQTHESRAIDPADATLTPLIPDRLWLRSAKLDDVQRVILTNAEDRPAAFELRLRLGDDERLVRADRPAGIKDGRPIFRLTLPPRSATVLRYQTGYPPIPSRTAR